MKEKDNHQASHYSYPNKFLEERARKNDIKAFFGRENVRSLTQEEYALQIKDLAFNLFGKDFKHIDSYGLSLSKDNFDGLTLHWRHSSKLLYEVLRERVFSIFIPTSNRLRVSEDTKVFDPDNPRMVNFNYSNSQPETNALIHTERLIDELQKRLVEKTAKDTNTNIKLDAYTPENFADCLLPVDDKIRKNNIFVFTETCREHPDSMEDAMITIGSTWRENDFPKIVSVLREKNLLNQNWWTKLRIKLPIKELCLTNGFTLRNPKQGSTRINWELAYNNKSKKA